MDLIALALRLSLAQVASGDNGLSFLILDECFGSQDPQRRNSILESLRNLKETYNQILIISHVENMEDYVDKVITIETSTDRKNSYVVEGE
jgi:exonuclease SbcC